MEAPEKAPTVINLYEFIRVIGSGAYGCVILVRHVNERNHQLMKIKEYREGDNEFGIQRRLVLLAPLFVSFMIKNLRIYSPLSEDYFRFMQDTDCAHLIPRWRRQSNFVFQLSEYVSGGHVRGSEMHGTQEVHQYVLCIGYLLREGRNKYQLVHSDIKPDNMLHRLEINKSISFGEFEFRPRRGRVPVLIDFGVCYTADDPPANETRGTYAFFPPEMLIDPSRGHLRMDMWALALSLVDPNLVYNQRTESWAFGVLHMGEYVRHVRGPGGANVSGLELDMLMRAYLIQYGMGNGIEFPVREPSPDQRQSIVAAITRSGVEPNSIQRQLVERGVSPIVIEMFRRMMAWVPIYTWDTLLASKFFRPFLKRNP